MNLARGLWRVGFPGVLGATMTLALLGAVTVTTASASTPQGSSPSIAVSTSAGPVGTKVTVSGNTGSACTSTTTLVEVEFLPAAPEPGASFGRPFATLRVPVGEGGKVAATFVVPSYLHGGATFAGEPVVPGSYLFEIRDQCGTASAPYAVTAVQGGQPSSRFVGIAPTPTGNGYWLTQVGGGVYSYGAAAFYGSLPGIGVTPATGVTGIASTPTGRGYWLVSATGGVYAFGSAGFYGSLPGLGIHPYAAVVGIAPTPTGSGYWLVGSTGGVFAFGGAGFYGHSSTVARTSISPAPGGDGYLEFGQTDVFPDDSAAFGTARTTPTETDSAPPLATLLTGAVATADARGYWMVGADGGVFSFGTAPFYGSLPGIGVSPAGAIVDIAATPTGGGYWLLGTTGGVFAFGDAGFFGSAA